MTQDTFDRLFERFGVLDVVVWTSDGWLRAREFSDDAWCIGRRLEPIVYFGA